LEQVTGKAAGKKEPWQPKSRAKPTLARQKPWEPEKQTRAFGKPKQLVIDSKVTCISAALTFLSYYDSSEIPNVELRLYLKDQTLVIDGFVNASKQLRIGGQVYSLEELYDFLDENWKQIKGLGIYPRQELSEKQLKKLVQVTEWLVGKCPSWKID
jgi:hypothetical protein